MSYFIYHDKGRKRAKVHRGKCSWCNDGNGVRGDRDLNRSEWYGPFDNKQQAIRDTKAREIASGVTECGYCKP